MISSIGELGSIRPTAIELQIAGRIETMPWLSSPRSVANMTASAQTVASRLGQPLEPERLEAELAPLLGRQSQHW